MHKEECYGWMVSLELKLTLLLSFFETRNSAKWWAPNKGGYATKGATKGGYATAAYCKGATKGYKGYKGGGKMNSGKMNYGKKKSGGKMFGGKMNSYKGKGYAATKGYPGAKGKYTAKGYAPTKGKKYATSGGFWKPKAYKFGAFP